MSLCGKEGSLIATTVARLQAVLDADTRRFDSAMGRSQTKTQKFGMIAKSALIGGAAAGLYAFGKAAKIGWDEYNAGQQVAAQTNAVIKSTGGVANVSAKHVEELGESLMRKSGVDDEVIKSSENLLLTFRDIRNEVGKGNDVFDRATKAALDVSVAFHKDLNSASVMVGKALQDPVKGLTSLTRVGIQFSDKQKAVIANLVETGKKAEAQKLILKELEKQAGGSAEALGDTLGGQLSILRERFNNWAGDMVEKAIPYLKRFLEWAGPKAHQALQVGREAVRRAREAWDKFAETLRRHQDTLEIAKRAIDKLVEAIKPLVKWNLLLYGTIFKVWMKILDVVLTVTDKVIGAIRTLIGWLKKIAGPAHAAAQAFAKAFQIMLGPILIVIDAVQRLIDLIQRIPVVGSIGSGSGSDFYSGGHGGPRGATPRTLSTPRMAAGGTTVINVNGALLDGERVLNIIAQANRTHVRRNGRSAF